MTAAQCYLAWCTETIEGHTWHEGVAHQWIGADPHLHDTVRVLQVIVYGTEPPGQALPVQRRIAVLITGPDLREPDRVSVTLPLTTWFDVAEAIDAAASEPR